MNSTQEPIFDCIYRGVECRILDTAMREHPEEPFVERNCHLIETFAKVKGQPTKRKVKRWVKATQVIPL